MAQPGGNVQLESSSEHYRELAVDVEGLEEMDWSKGQKKGDSKTIQNGLLLSYKSQKQAFISYTYALTPLSDSPSRVDWKILTAEGLECQHIRYHQLQPGDSLNSLATKYKKLHAVSIVLANTEDSLQLAPEFKESAVKLKKGSLAVILISSEDGKSLREFLNRHDTGELYARIESKNMPQVELQSSIPPGVTYSPSPQPKSGAKHRGIRASFRRGTRRLSINLKDEIKQLMFPINGPVCVSEDEGLFKVVMSTFYQHEQMIQREAQHCDGAVFRKLTKHLDEMFARDFPFYLIVAFRVHRKHQLYHCDELSPFIQSCINKFEKLEQVSISKTLETFLKMDNFKIMFDPSDARSTVFHLLQEACIELMQISFTLKSSEGSQLGHRYVYYRMLWISVASKCHIERGCREHIGYWEEYFTASQRSFHLDTDTIQSVKRGVEFGRLLQLPDEVSFRSDHMADILVSEGSVRPFSQVREFVSVLEPYVQLEEEFVKNFMQKPRSCYEACFHEGGEDKLKAVHPEGNLLAILQEGLAFLDTALEVCRKRHWKSESMDEEMKRWLSLLLQCVDITSDRAESYLKDFLTTKSGITKQFSEHIKRELIVKLQENFANLSTGQFLQLYKAFFIWPTWVVEGYLREYKIPKEVKICSSTWNELFSVFVERFTDAEHHTFLLEFLKSVAQCYLAQGRASHFILDVLQLDVPNLFGTESEGSTSTLQSDILSTSVPDQFTHFLSDYVKRNALQEALLSSVETIWESIVEHSEFQQLVLMVIQQELVPKSLPQDSPPSKFLRFLLKECVTAICANMSSFQDLSSRLIFCWGVVASCCAIIPISDKFSWINSYQVIISELSRIYGVYCSSRGVEEHKLISTSSDLPDDIKESTCNDVKTFFSWVFNARRGLIVWKEKFANKDVNYDEVLLYAKNFSHVNRVASVFAEDSSVVDNEYVQATKQDFLQSFELLNIFLLRYIKDQPNAGWCSLQQVLAKYGVGLPAAILLPITQHVILPDERDSEKRRSLRLKHHPPPAISKNFLPGLDISLEITRELTLHELKLLVQGLAAFIGPIEDQLDMLVFFCLYESEVFDKYLKLQLLKLDAKPEMPSRSSTPAFTLPAVVIEKKKKRREQFMGVPVETLATALLCTRQLLMKLVKGTASYTDIIADGSLNLKSLDIDHEFRILNDYAKYAEIENGDVEGLEGVKAMLQLFQYTQHIKIIVGVCTQYQLEQCLSDPDLQELVDLVKTLEVEDNCDKLTAKEAIMKKERVIVLLHLDSRQNAKHLDLFAAVADSAAFHQFIVTEKGFVGEQGQALFQQQYQLVTTHLQHEEYNESVLNHLFAAFQFITPFTDTTQNFSSLMDHVSKLNDYDQHGQLEPRKQLETVNKNINLIRLWFSRAEGDTLQGVARDLNHVFSTGYYQFVFGSTPTGVSPTIQLKYRPLANPSEAGGETGGPSAGDVVEQKWNEKEIEDFVRKLGFLDAGGSDGNQINHFLHLNQTAKKLMGTYSKLRELGHPEYLRKTLTQILPCRLSQEQADQKVYEAAQMLSKWREEVSQLRIQYEQLLFFSIPKLLHLFRMITAEKPEINAIVQEVGFLFQNKPLVLKKLKETVQDLLSHGRYSLTTEERQFGNTPMHVVGSFLAALFQNFELSTYTLKHRRPSSVLSRSPSSQSAHILHSCQGFTQSQLLRLIISIYGGVPEVFEVFHCRHNTTEEELRLFLNPKRATKRPFQYLILEVNRLPYQLQEALLCLHFDLKQHQHEDVELPCVHFIETAPSLLQEMPWILHKDYKGAEPSLDFHQAVMTCQKSALDPDDFSCIQLVYGNAGDGKTHYIESQLQRCPFFLRIAVNEAFTPLNAIHKLSKVPLDTQGCAVFFNFTMLPPGDSVDDKERLDYTKLIETIGWFFSDLFILGYVEDPVTGNSFRFPGGMQWAVYVEVPSRDQMTPNESLREFFEDVPALGLLGTPHCIYPQTPFVIDADVQLVCKYLKAYRIGGTKGIDRLYRETSGFTGRKPGIPIKFSVDLDLPEAECHKLLDQFTPQHMKKNKTLQKLFVKYMKRRCHFLDNCPAFNYNAGSTEYIKTDQGQQKKNDTSQLGSTLMDTMLKEVSDFCDPIIRENWSLKPHHQLIYDFKDGGGSLGLMSLHPDRIADEDKERFKKIGVEIPSMLQLYTREYLDFYISRALDVPLDEHGRLGPVDDSAYVLTLDFAIKMLNIHERAECGVPVIIEGETGVGKTALVDMLSKLWNYSLLKNWNLYRARLMEYIRRKLGELPPKSLEEYPGCMDSIATISAGKAIREEDLILIGELPDSSSPDGQFYSVMREEILKLVDDPVLSLIELRSEDKEAGMKFSRLFAAAQYKNNPKDTAKLLYTFLSAKLKSTFHKLNVHAALQPSDIMKFFQSVFKQAQELSSAFEGSSTSKIPFVTVFLDEVNTTSCLGLFKEIIVDRTLDGKPIPKNIFIVGACNPHRGNSLGSHDSWVRGSYYVRQLHPTLQCLMWDYGALGEQQEREYVLAKMKMSASKRSSSADLANYTELIITSQNLMREYALEQLKSCNLPDSEASSCSRSCVSQRDIQRLFTFYEWLTKMYKKLKPYGKQYQYYNARAVVVAMGLVYYLRLDTKHRKKYREVLDHHTTISRVTFSKVFEEELEWYINHIDLPAGIAKTQALKENIFATIVCTMTHTPLIIVGPPGSSKTLSFNLTLANLKGQESKMPIFRNTDIFRSLDPQIYQCSRRTTSTEISTVFNRAINRQISHTKVPLPVYCVVFMDEAGLPEERHESLKVLHYYLDRQEVSFLAISNHVMDAAKTNRAVSLFRPEGTPDDLVALAKGCLCSTPENPPPELKKDLEIVASFCPAYNAIMQSPKYKGFFGLRDFIHFISYLRRKRMEMLSPQLVMEALERNFNGLNSECFKYICKLFLRPVHATLDNVKPRNILDVLYSSLSDHPVDSGAENDVRYKLIIDPSEDGSLVRLLFSSGVLQRENTRVYVCSDFPGDAQVQKINTIGAVRHSATEGHTVVMMQTDAIHESFYDLFNRRFHRIDAKTGPRYYANIAIGAHIKPCRVHRDFECVVIAKQSEVEGIPPPFLNRFEKYFLSHEQVLESALAHLSPCLAITLRTALEKTKEFLEYIGGPSSIYGLQKDTANSLILTLLPPINFTCTYRDQYQPSPVDSSTNIKVWLLETLLNTLRSNAGFQIPHCSPEELQLDAEEVFAHVLRDSEFAGRMQQLTPSSAQEVVKEALRALYRMEGPSGKEVKEEVSVDACMVVSVLVQWLTRHLCLRLVQLMTSEALCMHYRRVPTSYIESYLNHQHHFSLKSLLETQSKRIGTSKKPVVATKLICFTRSSQLLHQLPMQYPSIASQADTDSDMALKELVYSNLEQLVVHKLTAITSYTTMNELLRSFVNSDSQRIMLLLINMQETSKEVVNHLRIMIEEAESQSTKEKKLFVLLLHFSASRLTPFCYPSMFLQGWDFHYLDIIGYSPKGGMLDVRDWFRQCYASLSPDSSVTLQLTSLLREAIPVVASRVFFGSYEQSSFNKPMGLPERSSALEDLFFDKGVGDILCDRFNSYWQPNVMVEYLEKAVALAHQRETTLNVIDSLQAIFKNLFFDFLVHMVSKINQDMNIDVIFNSNCSPAVQSLFLDMLRVYPIPKLSELKMLRITSSTSHCSMAEDTFAPPTFPFFHLVSAAMEKLVDQSRREINQNMNMLSDQANITPSLFQNLDQDKTQVMTEMIKMVHMKLQDKSEIGEGTCLSVAIQALSENDALWQKYLEDFTHQRLHLEYGNTGTGHKILRAAFGKLEQREAFLRLSILHVYVHIHKLNLAKVVSILRPLDKIEVAVSVFPSLSEKIHNPAQSFLHDVQDSGDFLGRPEALSVFIIDTLFGAIAGIGMSCHETSKREKNAEGEKAGESEEAEKRVEREKSTERENGETEEAETISGSEKTDEGEKTAESEKGDVEQLKLWFKVYRDVMSMPTLKEHIYTSRSVVAEAQHNVMHALFVVLCSKTAHTRKDLQKGLRIFNHLLEKHFNSNLELQGEGPRLGDVACVVFEELTGAQPPVALTRDSHQVRYVAEGLLGHFFPEHHTSYHQSDIWWFLDIANKQAQWQTNFLMNEVIEVEYSVDLLSQLDFNPDCMSVDSSIHRIQCRVPMSVFKFYLYRILLRSIRGGDDPVHSILMHFQKSQVHSLIADVLCAREDLGNAAPYIPTFYQYCEPIEPCPAAENQLMQQPLSHLYFLTVFEDLLKSDFKLSGLIQTAQNITKQCEGGSVPEEERVLLYIEKQATIQVMIRKVAQNLNIKDSSKIQALFAVMPDLNSLLDDESMGGGSVGGHGLVLALHLLRELRSFNLFTSMLTKQYNLLCDGINCLEPFHRTLQIESPSHVAAKADQLFLPYPDMGQEFHSLYQKVSTALAAVHTTHGATPRVKDLTRIAVDCSRGNLNIVAPSGDTHPMAKSRAFRMVLWLCTYNEFFAKKKPSQMVARVVEMDLGKHLEPQFTQLLCCFLNPESVLRKGGAPTKDPIISLLLPSSNGNLQDQSDADLHTALMHMITVTVGCPSHSTHLWYHMFNIEELKDNYITGFLYNSRVGPSYQFYDQGVELTDEGLYCHHDYTKHATRGTLSLHSLYLLLWANFAAFCTALLFQSEAEDKLVGNVFSESVEPVRQYCVSQLHQLWGHLRNSLAISDEERLLLVRGCLNQLFELHLKSPSSLQGKLSTRKELDRYEEMWHSLIFTPNWNTLKDTFVRNSPMVKNRVFKDIQQLDIRYPWFPTEQTLMHCILSQADLGDPSTNHLYPLSCFVLEYAHLRIGGDLLPGIVELYQWLNTELAYAVTYEEATTITLGRLAKVLAKHSSPGSDRKAHYEKLKCAFNDYVRLTGCTRSKRPLTVGDDTPLIHLLSHSVDGEQGNDLLYTVIVDIITFHNQFLSTLLNNVRSSSTRSYCFPENVPRVHAMEFTQYYRLVGRSKRCSDLLQLIHSRSHLPLAFPTDLGGPSPIGSNLPGQMTDLIDLHKLQDDILATCIAGKPLIDEASIASMRIPFKFKEDTSGLSLHISLRDCAVNLEGISQKLPDSFKIQLDDTYRKRLEYEFHSASYHTIMEMVTGLRTAVSHLIKEVSDSPPHSSKCRQLQPQTLPQFLVSLYEYDPADETKDVFHEICIHSLSQTQHACLENLYLPFLYHTLKIFVQWAEEGWYDFCSLPFPAKMQMSLPDEDTMRQIPSNYDGSSSELLHELKSLVDVLVHLETSIIKMATQKPQNSLMHYLKELQVCSGRDRLIVMIPESIKLEHYVSLRLVLRRLITEVQAEVSHDELNTPEPKEDKWDDFITDLWDVWLPHFRQRGYVYTSTRTHYLEAGNSPAGRGNRSSKILSELIHYSSDTNLLETMENASSIPSLHDSTTTSAGDICLEDHQVSPGEAMEMEVRSNRTLIGRLTSYVEAEELQEKAKQFSLQDIVSFLQSKKLDQYATTFEEYDINGELLIQFQDDDLEDIKITNPLHRLIIRICFRRLVIGTEEFASQYHPQAVAQFLEGNKQLKQFSQSFLENGIDGELLLNASDAVMKELGVEKGIHMRMIRTKFKSWIA